MQPTASNKCSVHCVHEGSSCNIADGSMETMECLFFSNDSGKATAPSGTWEMQVFALNKDYRICPVTWFAMWTVTKHEAPGWKVCFCSSCNDTPMYVNCCLNCSLAG